MAGQTTAIRIRAICFSEFAILERGLDIKACGVSSTSWRFIRGLMSRVISRATVVLTFLGVPRTKRTGTHEVKTTWEGAGPPSKEVGSSQERWQNAWWGMSSSEALQQTTMAHNEETQMTMARATIGVLTIRTTVVAMMMTMKKKKNKKKKKKMMMMKVVTMTMS